MNKFGRIQQIAMTLVIALAMTAVVAVAQTTEGGGKEGKRGHFGRHGGRGDFAMMGFRQLDLTDAQKAQLKQIRESHQQAIAPLMQELRAKRQEMRQASQGGAFDEATATAKLKEIAPLEAKLMGEQSRIHQEMLNVLTADQKAKLEQLREQAKTRWSERRANKQQKTN